MKNLNKPARWAGVGVLALALVGTAGAVAFGDDQVGDASVDINVKIEKIEQPGFLAMSVASNSVQLQENGSDSTRRQFTGTLPTVTVTDSRSVDEIPADAAWAVLGSVSNFTGSAGQADIAAGHLGWEPSLVSANDGDGLVVAGDAVDTVLDQGPSSVGLKDKELLVSTWNSAQVHEEGSWEANAEMFLRTPVDVEPGNYSSVLTLSLFE